MDKFKLWRMLATKKEKKGMLLDNPAHLCLDIVPTQRTPFMSARILNPLSDGVNRSGQTF
jgi:hypothetical protein